MTIEIRRIEAGDYLGFHECLDSVAKEKKYLAKEEAPPLENIRKFVEENAANGATQFVAVVGGKIVGWCDAFPFKTASLSHRAELGVGVARAFRGQGIGKRLIESVLAHAATKGVKRIGLEVRSDNASAIGLYSKMGFTQCGLERKGIYLEGRFYDLVVMEYLAE